MDSLSHKAAMKRLHQSGHNTSHQIDHSAIVRSIAHLWKRNELCDCVLVSSDQQKFAIHKIVLAAASHYFKVLFLGTGQHMLNSAVKDEQGIDTVQLDGVDGHSLELVLQAVYQEDFQASLHHNRVCAAILYDHYITRYCLAAVRGWC